MLSKQSDDESLEVERGYWCRRFSEDTKGGKYNTSSLEELTKNLNGFWCCLYLEM